MIHCEYGIIPVKSWLAREVWRIMRNPNRVAAIKEGEGRYAGYLALFVNFKDRSTDYLSL